MHEANLDSDTPTVTFNSTFASINSDLTIGTDTSKAKALIANQWLSSRGMMLFGAGFIVTSDQAAELSDSSERNASSPIRPYVNGRDIMGRSRDLFVIDFYGLSAESARRQHPKPYSHVLRTVKPERDENRDLDIKERWWLFGRTRDEIRPALCDIKRFIVTVETARHRVFQFLNSDVTADNKLVLIASDDPYILGVLSSSQGISWSVGTGGWLGAGNDSVYVKTKTFDPFPFPDATLEQRQRIGALAEELDAIRKQVLAEHGDLTLTGLYNLRDKVRKGEPLDMVEQDQRQRGLIDLICELHDRIDGEVADAYGWPRDLSDEEIVARLVALNAERHAEEQRGIVRWLRPEYQIPKAGVIELRQPEAGAQIEAVLPEAAARKPMFPRDAIGQTAAVIAELRGEAVDAEAIARRYSQGLKIARRVQATLDALERLGHVHRGDGGYSLRKVA